jgi:hypothetical protein
MTPNSTPPPSNKVRKADADLAVRPGRKLSVAGKLTSTRRKERSLPSAATDGHPETDNRPLLRPMIPPPSTGTASRATVSAPASLGHSIPGGSAGGAGRRLDVDGNGRLVASCILAYPWPDGSMVFVDNALVYRPRTCTGGAGPATPRPRHGRHASKPIADVHAPPAPPGRRPG